MLVLVGEDQLVDEAVAEHAGRRSLEVDAVEDVQRPLAHLRHVVAQLVAAQDRQLVAGRPRVLDRVVEAAELAVHRLAPADRLDQPQLLEVGDVAEVPGQRTQDLAVDGVELLVGERLDQQQRALARLREAVSDRVLRLGRGRRRRDGETLDVPRRRFVTNAPTNSLLRRWKLHGAGALISGGASGLGEATTRRLHAAGAAIVIADLNAEKGKALAAELGDRARSSRRT